MPNPAYADQLKGRQVVWEPTEKQNIFLAANEDEVLYGGAAGGGKLLCMDTPIPTPDGWKAIGSLIPGDSIFGRDGKIYSVLAVSRTETPVSYRVGFDDGSTIDACEDHQWLTFNATELSHLSKSDPEWKAKRRASRPSRATGKRSKAFTDAITARNKLLIKTKPCDGSIRTTKEIANTLMLGKRTNHAVPVCEPLELPEQNLPIDPYILGCWLGDGTSLSGQMTSADIQVIELFKQAGFQVTKHSGKYAYGILGLVTLLKKVGVVGNKHVPEIYLRASKEQRLALLQGLMDTDGHACESGSVEFVNTNIRIAEAVIELALSLGHKAAMSEGRASLNGVDCGPKYRIKWTPPEYVFRLDRKRERQKIATRRTTKFRYITSCEPIDPVPMRCIRVSSPDNLYLAGRSMIPTHNSIALLIDALGLANGNPNHSDYRAIIFRRSFPELRDLIERSNDLYTHAVPGAVYNMTEREWRFPSGAKVEFGYAEGDQDRFRYQGRAFHYIAWDELTQWPTDTAYVYLMSRLRSTNPAIKCYVRATCNPGGPGHEWVKARWKISDDGEASKFTVDVHGSFTSRRFIPARLDDNPYLKDTGYKTMLLSQSKNMRRALLEGRWDVSDIEGSIYKTELEDLYLTGRVCNIPIEKMIPVNTFWDLGRNDLNAIWFHQRVGKENRFIDYYENRLEGLDHYVKVLQDKGYLYGTHYLPHDVDVRELSTNKSRKVSLEEAGVRPIKVVEKITNLMDGVEMVRRAFPSYWFDKARCDKGLKGLKSYRREFNEKDGVFKARPLHDWASASADAIRQHAQGYEDYQPVKIDLSNYRTEFV